MTTAPIDTILGLVGAAKPGTYRCPAHDDDHGSLAVAEGADGEVLLHCHAGCTTEAVMHEWGLPMSALFPPRSERADERKKRIVATYDYTDETGQMIYQVCRYDPKDFRQRHPDGQGGWRWNIKGCRPVLYRLPQVIDAIDHDKVVWVVEGEKDVQAIERAGEVATCNCMGAGKWRQEYTAALAGATVCIIADADEAGRRHAAQVAVALREAGSDVSVFDTAAGFKDSAQHFGAGKDFGDLVIWPEERIPTRARGPLLENYWGGDDFLDRAIEVVAPWAIRGLLRINWRLVIVAVEGHGKSVLQRQLAICAAYGIHPLHFDPIPPQRTMIIDLENPDDAITETARPIRDMARVKATEQIPRNNWHLWTEPSGLDLRGKRDQQRFAERIERGRPQLVCMGPAYKTHPEGKDNDAEAVRAVMDFLDRMRTTYGFALVLEHHASKATTNKGQRDLVPFGTALWLRWPDLGFKLVPVRDAEGRAATAETMDPSVLAVRPFKGMRLKNSWPTEIHRSAGSPWPWVGKWSETQQRLGEQEQWRPEPF